MKQINKFPRIAFCLILSILILFNFLIIESSEKGINISTNTTLLKNFDKIDSKDTEITVINTDEQTIIKDIPYIVPDNSKKEESIQPSNSNSKDVPLTQNNIDKKTTVAQNVYQKKPIVSLSQSEKSVYLTIDDGYERASIIKALDILKDKKVKGTFFIIGTQLKANADLWKRAVNDGHEICNHTLNHVYFNKLSSEEVRNEIIGWDKVASEVLGVNYLKDMKLKFPFMRFPGGIQDNNTTYLEIVANEGYIPIGWSVETVYAVLNRYNLSSNSVDTISNKVREHVSASSREGSIILLHFNSYDIGNLGNIIDDLRAKGFDFKLVSEGV